MSLSQTEFLAKLQTEAEFQKKLSKTRLLPRQVDAVSAFVGTHVWQVVLSLSLLSAFLLEVIEKV